MEQRQNFLLILLLTFAIFAQCNTIQFNLVYGGVFDKSTQNFQLQIFDVNFAVPEFFTLTPSSDDLTVFTYSYTTSTTPSANNIHYNYIFNNITEQLTEEFTRRLEDCRIRVVDTQNNLWITKYEYFNQSQLYLGLNELPLFSENANGIPPEYYDDNQVMTLSFFLNSTELSELWDPSNRGDDYVKTNMTFVSLTAHKFLSQISIRRAGGSSLSLYPYSYQIKMTNSMNLGGIDRVFKLKAYPYDYVSALGGIISEKVAADIAYSLGAPINYVSYVRVYINHIDQGLYSMVEKVDDKFIERRWPYVESGYPVGSLYKVQGNFFMLDKDGWNSDEYNFLQQQADSLPICCPCLEVDCDIGSDDCSIGECGTLQCCECFWEVNGKLEIEESDCATQSPFEDFITLGNAILYHDEADILANLNSESYLKSLLTELAVMNADGYVYNKKNYYWYKNSVNNQFYLILYDQDTAFNQNGFEVNHWKYTNWTYTGNLADALFLPTLLYNQSLSDMNSNVLTSFIAIIIDLMIKELFIKD